MRSKPHGMVPRPPFASKDDEPGGCSVLSSSSGTLNSWSVSTTVSSLMSPLPASSVRAASRSATVPSATSMHRPPSLGWPLSPCGTVPPWRRMPSPKRAKASSLQASPFGEMITKWSCPPLRALEPLWSTRRAPAIVPWKDWPSEL